MVRLIIDLKKQSELYILIITVGWRGVGKITELDVMQWVQKSDRLNFTNEENVSSLSAAKPEKRGMCEIPSRSTIFITKTSISQLCFIVFLYKNAYQIYNYLLQYVLYYLAS